MLLTPTPFDAAIEESRQKRWRIAAIATLALVVLFMAINLFMGVMMTNFQQPNQMPSVQLSGRAQIITWWGLGLSLLVLAAGGLLIARKQFKPATLVNGAGLLILTILRIVLVFSTLTETIQQQPLPDSI